MIAVILIVNSVLFGPVVASLMTAAICLALIVVLGVSLLGRRRVFVISGRNGTGFIGDNRRHSGWGSCQNANQDEKEKPDCN